MSKQITPTHVVHMLMSEQDLSQSKLCEEIDRLHKELEKVPSFQDMYEYGRYSVYTYTHTFGSWNEAIRAAGYSTRPSREKHTRSELIAEIQRVAEKCGRKPTLTDIADYSDISRNTYHNQFESWNDALEAAGFDPRRSTKRISEAELSAALQELKTSVEGVPTTTDMDENGPYSPGVYINRYGSWKDALKTAGVLD